MTMAVNGVTTAPATNIQNKKVVYPKTFFGTAIGICMGIAAIRGGGKSSSLLYKSFAMPIMALPGVTIDYFTNERRKKFAEKTVGMTERQALQQDSNAYVTKKLNPYIKSNTGKKLGTLFGAAYLPLSLAASSKKASSTVYGIYAGIGAIGGFALGFLNDYLANWYVKRQADRINR